MFDWRRRWRPGMLVGVLALMLLVLQPLALPAPPARAQGWQGISPRDLAVTDDEAGKQATRSLEQEGSDGKSSWIRLQWERRSRCRTKPLWQWSGMVVFK